MIKNIYALKDVKSGFLDSFNAVSDNLAVRSIATALSNMAANPTDLFNFPEDFELWCLGSVDTDTGIIMPKQFIVMQVRDIKSLLRRD